MTDVTDIADEDNLESRKDDLLFGLRRSSRYHNRQRQFYEQWNTITVGLAAVGGLGTITALQLESGLWSIGIALLVSAFGAIDLTVGASRRANQHMELARDFILLEAEFVTSEPIDERTLADLTAKRLLIETRERPKLHLLDVICDFEVMVSMGDTTDPYRIPWWRKKLANLVSQADYAQKVAAAVQQ